MAYEFKFPDIGEGVSDGTIISWKVKEGDMVKEDAVLGEIETAKALVEMPSPKAGKVLKLHAKPGEKVKVGDTLVTIGSADETIMQPTAAPTKQTSPSISEKIIQKPKTTSASAAEQSDNILALPSTRKLAEELSIDMQKIQGTGFKGRITDDDVKKAAQGVEQRGQQEQQRTQEIEGEHVVPYPPLELSMTEKKTAPAVSFDRYGRTMRVPMTGIRKTIAERMQQSANIPQVTAMEDVDITKIAEVREREKAFAENKGIKLTYLPFIIKAAIIALKAHPYLNASLDEQKKEIIVREYYNIGFAYDAPQGLIVPVIHHADNESILDIAKKMEVLVEHIKDKDIKPEDLTGATFTVTNYGTIGTIYGTPLINLPNVAILGVGRIIDKPVVVDNQIVIRKILPLSISYDHRVVDGAEAARFMNDLKKHLEDPELLLVDMI